MLTPLGAASRIMSNSARIRGSRVTIPQSSVTGSVTAASALTLRQDRRARTSCSNGTSTGFSSTLAAPAASASTVTRTVAWLLTITTCGGSSPVRRRGISDTPSASGSTSSSSTRSGRHTRASTSAVRASPATRTSWPQRSSSARRLIGAGRVVVGDQRSRRGCHGHGVACLPSRWEPEGRACAKRWRGRYGAAADRVWDLPYNQRPKAATNPGTSSAGARNARAAGGCSSPASASRSSCALRPSSRSARVVKRFPCCCGPTR